MTKIVLSSKSLDGWSLSIYRKGREFLLPFSTRRVSRLPFSRREVRISQLLLRFRCFEKINFDAWPFLFCNRFSMLFSGVVLKHPLLRSFKIDWIFGFFRSDRAEVIINILGLGSTFWFSSWRAWTHLDQCRVFLIYLSLRTRHKWLQGRVDSELDLWDWTPFNLIVLNRFLLMDDWVCDNNVRGLGVRERGRPKILRWKGLPFETCLF